MTRTCVSLVSEWSLPLIVKRLNSRYDWLNGRWGHMQYVLVGAGDGCEPFPAAAGAVAWVSESGCSFFTKVRREMGRDETSDPSRSKSIGLFFPP